MSEREGLRFLIAVLAVLVHDTEGGCECSSHNPETSDGGETEFNKCGSDDYDTRTAVSYVH
jgi:hypothetical protein